MKCWWQNTTTKWKQNNRTRKKCFFFVGKFSFECKRWRNQAIRECFNDHFALGPFANGMDWNGVTNVHSNTQRVSLSPYFIFVCDPFLIRRSENTCTHSRKRNEHMYLVPYYMNKHTNNRFGLLMFSDQLIFYSFVAHFWRPQFLTNNYSTTETILDDD